MPYRDIFKRCIYGIDIQNYSIERCQILLNLLALTEGEVVDFEFNLLCADTLDFKSDEWNSNFDHFDVIVGNPPYVCGRNMEDDTRLKTNGMRYVIQVLLIYTFLFPDCCGDVE